MKGNRIAHIIILVLACLQVISAQAQPPLKEQIDVYTGFDPKVADAEKINSNPTIVDTVTVVRKIEYSIVSNPVTSLYIPDTIQAAKIRKEPLNPLKRFYVKLGFGNYTTPYGEVRINSLRNKANSYSLDYRHYSSWGKIGKVGTEGLRGRAFMMDNEANGMYSHFFKEHTINLKAGFTQNMVHYYGYNPEIDSTINPDDTRQRYNIAQFNADFFIIYRTDSIKVNHRVNLDFYHISDLYKSMENSLTLSGNVNKMTDLFAREFLGGDFKLRYMNYNNDTILAKHAFYMDVTPYMQLGGEKWNLKVGVHLNLAAGDSTKFNVYPDIRFKWNIFRNYIVLFANATGGYERNSFYELTRQNPFLMSMAPLKDRNEHIKVEAGLKGSFTSNLSYNAGISYSYINNFAYFINDTSNFSRRGFTVLYDRTHYLRVFGELSFTLGEKLMAGIKVNYHLYKPEDLAFAWQKPYIDGTITARYNLNNKLIFKADIFVIGPQIARTYITSQNLLLPTATQLNAMVDLNLGAEYRLTKMISFWVNVNNIAAWRYNRWYNYPTQQFCVLGGVTFTF